DQRAGGGRVRRRGGEDGTAILGHMQTERCVSVTREGDGWPGGSGGYFLDGESRRAAVRRLCLPQRRQLAFSRRGLRATRSAQPARGSDRDGARAEQLCQRPRPRQPERRGGYLPL